MIINLISAKCDLLVRVRTSGEVQKNLELRNKGQLQFFRVYNIVAGLDNFLRHFVYNKMLKNLIKNKFVIMNSGIFNYYANLFAFQHNTLVSFTLFDNTYTSIFSIKYGQKALFVNLTQWIFYYNRKIVINFYKFTNIQIHRIFKIFPKHFKSMLRLVSENINIVKQEMVNLQHCYIQPQEICLVYTITNNNLILNCTNMLQKKNIFTLSSSRLGFRGQRKLAMYAFVLITQTALQSLAKLGTIDLCVQFKVSPFFNKKLMLNAVSRILYGWLENTNIRKPFEVFQDNLNTTALLELESFDSYYTVFNDNTKLYQKFLVGKRNTLTIQWIQIQVFNGCRLKKIKRCKIRTRQSGKFLFAWQMCKELPDISE